ncbi:excinuclease ABC subunit B [candidate division KSB1 bacterium]|nr:MAG: excinuclease ABC subunit B [candidate division KSB1 bacterium]
MAVFKLKSNYIPRGDQPKAIKELTEGILKGEKYQTLLGVTGSGKTFTMANVIQNVGLPTLVISHNKTLAAQLYGEFKSFFPENAVEYFISYYDYYQPEAYIPVTDTYIEKDTSVNEEIDRLRLKATSSLLERNDVIVVASVSCIYGLGSPEDYQALHLVLKKGDEIERNKLLHKLIDIYYVRNDMDFFRGVFRAKGDVIEVFPAYEDYPVRVELFGDEIERITKIDAVNGEVLEELNEVFIYPAKHFVTTYEKLERAIVEIRKELRERLDELRNQNKLLEAQRLEQRTNFDLEMMQELGYCQGIENYSRYLSGRKPGQRPYTLIDYFPDEYLMFIDESHVTIPQIRGMFAGDRSRKETLVEYGFRLPSALDNRPLYFDEFESLIHKVIFVSATPADFELNRSNGVIVEQIIRPTGLMDPEIVVKPVKGQIDDLIEEIRKRVEAGERTLVLTLTKRMSEDLTEYLQNMGIKVRFLHSEIEALNRVEILRDLRLHEFDVLVGINLLREGLDLPEVSLVAILDADKEGFLRSERSLMQIAGRAARNINGKVILYADTITDSMEKVIKETERRRIIQKEYNEKNNIKPKSIYKTVEEVLLTASVSESKQLRTTLREKIDIDYFSNIDKLEVIEKLENEMHKAAKNLEFERAAEIRDQIQKIKELVEEENSKNGV